jgi:hypothetical protein
MGLYTDYINKHGNANIRRVVNIEWFLQKLDNLEANSLNNLGLIRLNGSYTFTGTINVKTPSLPSS